MCSSRSKALALAALLFAAPLRAAGDGTKVTPGVDVFLSQQPSALEGKKIGLITDRTGRTLDGKTDFEALSEAGITVAKIFTPEASKAERDALAGSSAPVSVILLRGDAARPGADALKGLDALVFDVQLSGARFDPCLTLLGYAMEEAAKAGLPFWVLDRPNPVKGLSEGPLPSPGLRSSSAYFPVPLRHGLTAGEIAKLHQAEALPQLELKVVKAAGWKRAYWFDQTQLDWAASEADLSDSDSALLYPAMALLEAANLSVGRGTPMALKWIGAPWLDREKLAKDIFRKDLPGIRMLPSDAEPSSGAYEGQELQGIFLDVTDRDQVKPFELFVYLACWLRDHQKEYQPRWNEIGRLLGSSDFERLYREGDKPASILKELNERGEAFALKRQPYLLYP